MGGQCILSLDMLFGRQSPSWGVEEVQGMAGRVIPSEVC